MPWPNIAVGMVIEYVHQSSVNGQALFYTNHYQVTNIGGTAPGGGPILSVGIWCHVSNRFPPPRIVDRQSPLWMPAASVEQVRR